MADASGLLMDAILRHRHAMAGFENRTVWALLAPLKAALADAQSRLAATQSAFQKARLSGVVAEAQAALVAAYRRLGRELPPALVEIAKVESEFTAGALSRAAAVSGPESIEDGARIITRALTLDFAPLPVASIEKLVRKPAAGTVLAESLGRQSRDVVSALRTSVSISLAEGEGMEAAARRFRKSADISKASAEGLVRTSIAAAENAVNFEMFRQHRDLLTPVWISTLDEVTCPVCAPRDAQPIEDGQIPPAHQNCRCSVVGRVRRAGEDEGETPVRGRASQDGPVRVRHYSEWFGRQSETFQREVLGESRFRLYAEGDLGLSSFSDRGEVLSLEELRQRHGRIFAEVFGDD